MAVGCLALSLLVVFYSALLRAAEVDECQVYYGGLIFPEGSRRTPEHGLHWSKTQSESSATISTLSSLSDLVSNHINLFPSIEAGSRLERYGCTERRI